MKKLLIPVLLIGSLAPGACDDQSPLGPTDAAFTADRAGSPALTVMSWNIYVGADLTQLLAIQDPGQIACGVRAVYEDVLATDFGARAVAIADQIEAFRPHVIGLNEVSTFDFVYETIPFLADLEFLAVLRAELASRGLDYDAPVDARSTNFQITLPISYAGDCEPQDLLSYTEYDVLLVRGDVPWSEADNGRFAQPLPLPFGLDPKYSGWASIDIEHKALPYRVFATHLEPADTGPCATDEPGLLFVHSAQAAELRTILDGSPHPTILTGDLNSDASGCTTSTYPDLLDDGFVDAWDIGRPRGNGYTSNQDADLRNASSKLWHRIDFVLYRDEFTAAGGGFRGAVHVERVGEEASDRVQSSATGSPVLLWPSDHAGVVADLRIAPGLGL